MPRKHHFLPLHVPSLSWCSDVMFLLLFVQKQKSLFSISQYAYVVAYVVFLYAYVISSLSKIISSPAPPPLPKTKPTLLSSLSTENSLFKSQKSAIKYFPNKTFKNPHSRQIQTFSKLSKPSVHTHLLTIQQFNPFSSLEILYTNFTYTKWIMCY